MARALSADDTRFIALSSLFFCHLFLRLLFLAKLNSVRLSVCAFVPVASSIQQRATLLALTTAGWPPTQPRAVRDKQTVPCTSTLRKTNRWAGRTARMKELKNA